MEVNPDLFALPGLDVTMNADGSSGLQFNLARALPVTAYVCPSCGRFKFMSALMLGNVDLPEPVQHPVANPAVKEEENS